MNFLVISDIHGDACVERIFEHVKADAILCLGDLLYHGPRNPLPDNYNPQAVIALLNKHAHKIIAVRGNCDAEVDQMMLQFPLTADYNSLFLDRRRVFMSHGHLYGPMHLPLLEKGSIVLTGHTHIPTAEKKDGIWMCNPGSPSLPKGSHPKSYGILNHDGFTVFTMRDEVYMHVDFDD